MPPDDDEFCESEVGSTTSECGGETPTEVEPEVYNAHWPYRNVVCGNRTVLLALTRNIPAGTAATITVKQISNNAAIFTRSMETYSNYFGTTWVSKKPTSNWNAPDVKFSAEAAGLSDDSHDPQLQFHRYPDLTGEYYRAHVESVGAVANYEWDRLVYVRVIDRVLHIQVPIIVTVHTGSPPERGKLQSLSSYHNACEREPVRGDGNLTDAEKTQFKNWIQGIYRQQVALHRQNCGRHGDPCDCPPSRKCCKMEIKVWVLFYDRNDARPATRVQYWNGGGRANSSNWYSGYVTSGQAPVVFAHEVGHLMGFFDEYNPDGAWGPSPWVHPNNGALMGHSSATQHRIETYYFDIYAQWLSRQTGEPWRVVRY